MRLTITQRSDSGRKDDWCAEAEGLSLAGIGFTQAEAEWLGTTLDYGEWTREVVLVEIDDRDRIVLYARGEDEPAGLTPDLASQWEDACRAPAH